jgi:ATP/maltotriose-dependent transcriptional regulator MalT
VDDFPAARTQFAQALQGAKDIHYVSLMLAALLAIGELLLKRGAVEQGLEWVALVRHHPASDGGTQSDAQQLLASIADTLSPGLLDTAIRRGCASDLSVAVDGALAEMARLAMQMESEHVESQALLPALPGPEPRTAAWVDPLTPREVEVLQLIAAGLSNRAIAEELVIATGTVKRYTADIYAKLGVRSRTQAVARARELKLLA